MDHTLSLLTIRIKLLRLNSIGGLDNGEITKKDTKKSPGCTERKEFGHVRV